MQMRVTDDPVAVNLRDIVVGEVKLLERLAKMERREHAEILGHHTGLQHQSIIREFGDFQLAEGPKGIEVDELQIVVLQVDLYQRVETYQSMPVKENCTSSIKEKSNFTSEFFRKSLLLKTL